MRDRNRNFHHEAHEGHEGIKTIPQTPIFVLFVTFVVRSFSSSSLTGENMIRFDYQEPTTLKKAFSLMEKHGDEPASSPAGHL